MERLRWGCREPYQFDTVISFAFFKRKKVLCRNKRDYTFKLEVFCKVNLLLPCISPAGRSVHLFPVTAALCRFAFPPRGPAGGWCESCGQGGRGPRGRAARRPVVLFESGGLQGRGSQKTPAGALASQLVTVSLIFGVI